MRCVVAGIWATAMVIAIPGTVGGCIGGSLASDTGPLRANDRWSTAGRQKVHVGEEVAFDFLLTDWLGRPIFPGTVADYCAVLVGPDRIECEPGLDGRFSFSYRFDRFSPGDKVTVVAGAYRERGYRDYGYVRGAWLPSSGPYEKSDSRVARDAITIDIYQLEIELAVPRRLDELLAETGVLRIRRSDGGLTSIYLDKPDRPGFAFTGSDDEGGYRVRFVPHGDSLNPTGTTSVEFTIRDTAGRAYTVSETFDTP